MARSVKPAAPSPHAQFGRRERQIVDAVYRLGRASVSEVRAALDDPPSYSAVRGMLNLLEEKGHLRHVQDGLRYVYLPVVEPERASKLANATVHTPARSDADRRRKHSATTHAADISTNARTARSTANDDIGYLPSFNACLTCRDSSVSSSRDHLRSGKSSKALAASAAEPPKNVWTTWAIADLLARSGSTTGR